MRATLTACVLLLAAAGQAAAQEGCHRFEWSVERERALFADGFTADVESEAVLPRDGAFSLMLRPVAQVPYVVVPQRGRDDGFGGVVTLDWIGAGRWQVTVSEDVWIDAIQNERRLPPLATTARGDCPGVRKSLRIEIRSLPLTLQFGGAGARRLNVSVLPVR
ncbi:MAG: hypothetical protein ACOY4R_14195 [Pseudomonadota bacterium]